MKSEDKKNKRGISSLISLSRVTRTVTWETLSWVYAAPQSFGQAVQHRIQNKCPITLSNCCLHCIHISVPVTEIKLLPFQEKYNVSLALTLSDWRCDIIEAFKATCSTWGFLQPWQPQRTHTVSLHRCSNILIKKCQVSYKPRRNAIRKWQMFISFIVLIYILAFCRLQTEGYECLKDTESLCKWVGKANNNTKA